MPATRPTYPTVAPVPEGVYEAWLRRLRRLHKQLPEESPSGQQPTREQIAQRAKEIWIRNGRRQGTQDQDWRDAETELRREVVGSLWRQVVPAIEAILHHREITIAFGGHQKAGKSTLVNGAMRRTILAVNDLPETGTLCRVTVGEKDEAVVVRDRAGKSKERIPCTTEALRDVTALQPGTVRKRGDQLAVRVELILRGVSVPPGVYWIDSPGLDDKADMTARAREAADMADVLVFVSSSRQFLSDSETAYLTEHIARHGPASVVMAINAWIEKPTKELWAKFLSYNMEHHRNRLAERASDMGFTAHAPLLAYPLVGRTLAKGDGALFGGTAFMNMLLEVRSVEHPRVRRTRLYRASERLRQLAEQLEVRRQALHEKVKQEERAAQSAAKIAEQRRKRFRRQVGELVGELVTKVAQQVRQAGASVRESVTDDWSTLTAGATLGYDHSLSDKASAAAEEGMKAFLLRLRDIISENKQKRLQDKVRDEIWEMISSPNFNVIGGADIAKVGEGAEIAGAAAAGVGSLWLGIVTFGIGTAVAAGAGAIAARIAREMSQAEAAATVKNAIRSSIDAQASNAASIITGNREAILKLVLEECVRPLAISGPNSSQHAAIRELEMLGAEAHALAQAARQLAGAGE